MWRHAPGADLELAEAKVLAARTHRPLGSIVDDALRVLFQQGGSQRAGQPWTFPTSGAGGVQPGVNLEDREALTELLGDNDLP